MSGDNYHHFYDCGNFFLSVWIVDKITRSDMFSMMEKKKMKRKTFVTGLRWSFVSVEIRIRHLSRFFSKLVDHSSQTGPIREFKMFITNVVLYHRAIPNRTHVHELQFMQYLYFFPLHVLFLDTHKFWSDI